MYSDENVVKPKWQLGRVLNPIVGKDGVTRGLVIKSVQNLENFVAPECKMWFSPMAIATTSLAAMPR